MRHFGTFWKISTSSKLLQQICIYKLCTISYVQFIWCDVFPIESNETFFPMLFFVQYLSTERVVKHPGTSKGLSSRDEEGVWSRFGGPKTNMIYGTELVSECCCLFFYLFVVWYVYIYIYICDLMLLAMYRIYEWLVLKTLSYAFKSHCVYVFLLCLVSWHRNLRASPGILLTHVYNDCICFSRMYSASFVSGGLSCSHSRLWHMI